MNFGTVRGHVLNAVAGVFIDEPELVNAGRPCEQAFQFQFARRLASDVQAARSVPRYDVDCEYRRAGAAVKRFPVVDALGAQVRHKAIVPDVIVHRRNLVQGQTVNLLAVEIKPRRTSDTVWFDMHDRLKLRLLCNQIQPQQVSVGADGDLRERVGPAAHRLAPPMPAHQWQYKYGLFLLVATNGVRLDWFASHQLPPTHSERLTAADLQRRNFPPGPAWRP